MTITDGVGANALEYKVCEYAPYFEDDGNTIDGDTSNRVSDKYAYFNCKQDIGLISDEDLLGTVVYGEQDMKESVYGKENHQKYSKLMQTYLDDYLSNTNDKQAYLKFKMTSSMLQNMDKSLVQQDITFQTRRHENLRNYSGLIDGVIAWNKLYPVMTADCDGNGEADNPDGKPYLCITGLDQVSATENLGQNGSAKQDAILSDIGSLMNSISNTIMAIESDPMVKFCTTGRKVQGLDVYADRYNKKGDNIKTEEARFPNLIDSMKVTIAQSAIKKAQDNYNKKYKELDAQMRKENVKLAERIVQVREKRELEDRREIAARACLNLGMGSALPVTSDTAEDDLKSGQGYTAVSKNDDPYYRETVTTTFSPTTLICKKCTRTQNCTNQKGYKDCCLIDSRHCKEWGEAVETCEETQY
jgi:hypothetical protein